MQSDDSVEKASSRRALFFFLILVVLVLGIGIGTVISTKVGAEKPHANLIKVSNQPLALASGTIFAQGFSDVAKIVSPAVVNINTEAVIKASRSRRRPRGEPLFPELPFGEDWWEKLFRPDAPQRVTSLGSGVIVDSSGYIITNFHVINQDSGRKVAEKINIKLDDGTEFSSAKVVGYDESSDIAVLKIASNNPLPFARIGDSTKVKVGDWVLAIGSPFGLERTVTAGIISATGRVVPQSGPTNFNNYLQTDAAINRGNSGGPLVNMAGEIVGINTFISSPTGGSVGIGFAAPSKTVLNVYNQLISKGKFTRGFLGVYMEPMNANLASYFGVKDGKGVLVTEVDENSPAAKGGIKAEDVIVEFDGNKIDSREDLGAMVRETPPGKPAKLKVVRQGREKYINVTLGEMKEEKQTGSFSLDEREEEKPDKQQIGISFDDITPKTVKELGLKSSEGIVVTDVTPGSLAADAGLLENDLIVELNGKKVHDKVDFTDSIRRIRAGENIVLKILRRSQGEQGVRPWFIAFKKP